MVYFSKKQVTTNLPANIVKSDSNNNFSGTNTFTGSVVVPNPTNPNQAANKSYVDSAVGGCAKLGSANTFTQTNQFNNQTNFRGKVELKNNSSNNGAYLENFDYYNANYTALKFFTSGTNTLQIEVNHTANHATISAPTTSNNLEILNLKNPTNANDAANKAYVDSKVVFVTKNNLSFTRQTINTTAGQQVTKYYTNSIPYNTIDPNCTGIISIACSDIPAQGEHLVITYFPKRSGNNALIEIYQYNSSANITTNLQSANFQFVIQKSI